MPGLTLLDIIKLAETTEGEARRKWRALAVAYMRAVLA
jgi:hypothetical protein